MNGRRIAGAVAGGLAAGLALSAMMVAGEFNHVATAAAAASATRAR